MSVCKLTQLPVQLVKPALQAIPQTPMAQTAVPLLVGGAHIKQLTPQCLGSLLGSTQAPPQAMSGEAQLATHVVPLHI